MGHYNLIIATDAIRKYLQENKMDFLHKSDITYDFPYRVHKYMVQFGLSAKRANPLKEVKKIQIKGKILFFYVGIDVQISLHILLQKALNCVRSCCTRGCTASYSYSWVKTHFNLRRLVF